MGSQAAFFKRGHRRVLRPCFSELKTRPKDLRILFFGKLFFSFLFLNCGRILKTGTQTGSQAAFFKRGHRRVLRLRFFELKTRPKDLRILFFGNFFFLFLNCGRILKTRPQTGPQATFFKRVHRQVIRPCFFELKTRPKDLLILFFG